MSSKYIEPFFYFGVDITTPITRRNLHGALYESSEIIMERYKPLQSTMTVFSPVRASMCQ